MRIEHDGLTLVARQVAPPTADAPAQLAFALIPATADATVVVTIKTGDMDPDVVQEVEQGGRLRRTWWRLRWLRTRLPGSTRLSNPHAEAAPEPKRVFIRIATRVDPDGEEFVVDLPPSVAGQRVTVEAHATSGGRRVPANGDERATRRSIEVPTEARDEDPHADGEPLALLEGEWLALAKAGLRTPAKIGGQPLEVLRRTLGAAVAPERVETIHRIASAQTSLLNQLALDPNPADTGGAAQRCECDECAAATSPLAYLVDLVIYIEASVSLGTTAPLDIARLTSLLRQPLADLITTCASVSEPVREVRLIVETLRQQLTARGPGDTDVVCSPIPLPLDFLITGDIDGDLRDELVVGFRADPASPLALPPGVGGGFWVMDFDPVNLAWSHLRPMPAGVGADVLLDPGLRVTFSCCGDIDGDGRDEVILAVGNADGSVDPERGSTWFWALRHDPATGWAHINPAFFANNGADLVLFDPAVRVVQIVAGDIDGDGADELVIATTSPARPNACWVYKLVRDLSGLSGLSWLSLSPGSDPSLPTFEARPGRPYAPRLLRITDVDGEGRAEVLGLLDAPGVDGAALWAMAYDPPVGGDVGTVGTWRHVRGTNIVGPDVKAPWPFWPERAAQFTTARDRGGKGQLVLTPERTAGHARPGDPDRIFTVGFNGWEPYPWATAADVDAGAGGARLSHLVAADVDDDGRAEYVAVTEIEGRKMAFVMHRRADDTWEHLSPIAHHPNHADLTWTDNEHDLIGVLAADLDRPRDAVLDLRQELIFHGRTCNEIWVMSYAPGTHAWQHLSQSTPPDLASEYLMVAYRALLEQVGTSLEEMRALRGAEPADRQALADRLGIPLTPDSGGPDSLDQLLRSPAELTEALLEELFGLVDTTRNPLSSVLVDGDARRQVRGISLTGAVWSANRAVANVGPDGDLRLRIDRVNPAAVSVVLGRPDGRPVASGEGPPGGRIQLDPLFGSGLSGWIELDYRRNVTDVRVQALPKLTVWRLRYLRELWDRQDLTAPAGGVAPLAIDPDVVGPDDFRVPCAKTAGADRPFDLWLARRRWVDDRLVALTALQPDLDAMLATLRSQDAGGPAENFPWDGAPATSTFAGLAESLTRGTPAEAEAAAGTVRSALWLPVDAFLRLLALSARVRDVTMPPTAAEWSEVRSILVLAHKRRRTASWLAEEATIGCVIGPADFWAATRAPTEGEWPPPVPVDGVWIDPDAVARPDLPQGVAGSLAAGLLSARQRELDSYSQAVRTARPTGLEAMVVAALGAPAVGTTWRARVAALGTDLQSTDLTVAAAARAAAATEFGLDVGPFRRLAAADAALTAGRAPTETEWMDVEAVLTTARKRTSQYPAWAAQEAQLAALLTPWRARRAKLPRWRASDDTRLAWEQELRRRSRPAVVDPDRFVADWLRSRTFGEPTSALYTQRRTWLRQESDRLRTARTDGAELLAQLDAVLRAGLFDADEHPRLAADLARRRAAQGAGAVLEQVFGAAAADLPAVRADLDSADPATVRRAALRSAQDYWVTPAVLRQLADTAAAPPAGVPAADWDRFDNTVADASQVGRIVAAEEHAKATGARTAALLAQLGVTAAARAQLLRTRAVAIAGGPVLEDEWDAVVAIALRAAKQRRTGDWQRAEDGKVRLGPDSFASTAPADPAGEEGQPRAWLTTPEEVRWWQDTVAARFDLERTVVAGVHEAVARAEERSLPVLRDRLLAALSPPGADAPAWVQDHYLVDARAGACAVTTRAARAIDTLLALLWSLRTGQVRDTYPQLLLHAPTFDSDWRWIGSYASWRSAVLVRLYPENILRPNLRRHRSPAFDGVLDALRSGRQLTPARARQLAAGYAQYFRDVSSLDLSSLACARVEMWTRTGEEGAAPGSYDFLFATSEASGKLYWSTLARPGTATDPGYEQSFWQELPGFDAAISTVVGATTYRPSPPTPRAMTTAWVYVFVLTRDLDRQGVGFVRFNLVTRTWETPKDIEGPRNAPEFSAALIAVPATSPPAVAFTTTRPDAAGNPVRVQFRATMNAKGTAWNNDGVVELAQWRWRTVEGQLAGTPGDLFALDANGDGITELAVVPPAAGRIQFYAGHATTAVSHTGQTTRSIEAGALVCVGDFNADRRAEVAWTLASTATNVSRTTGVFVERLDAGSNTWVPDRPDPNSPEGASVRPLDVPVRTQFLLAGNIDRFNRDELLMAIPGSFDIERLPNGTYLYTGTWGAFWSVYGQDQRYIRNAPYSYVPDPDRRTPYDFDVIGSAFTAFSTELATALAVTGDFDGDHFDELVVFFAPWVKNNGDENYSVGNDFTAVDVRRDRKMRTMGPVVNPDLNTVGDLSADSTVVAAAFAADIDGDGCDELIAIPYIDDAARGSKVWAWKFHAGGGVDQAEGGYWAALPDLDLSRDMTAVAHGVAADLDGDGAQELLLFGAGRSWAVKYISVLGRWEVLPEPVPQGTTVAAAVAGRFLPGAVDQVIVAFGTVQPEQWTDTLPYFWSDARAVRSRYVRRPNSSAVRMLALTGPPDFAVQNQCSHTGIAPAYTGSGPDWLLDDHTDLAVRRARTRRAFTENADAPASTMTYLWEAFHAVPVAIGLALQRAGDHTHALDWFRLVYDYTQTPDLRKTFYGLVLDEQTAGSGFGGTVLSWLHDPLDVNAIAGTRPNTFTRGMVQLIINCLLDAGDAEFTSDTAESIERARLLYGAALELLALPVVEQQYGECAEAPPRSLAETVALAKAPDHAELNSRPGVAAALDMVAENANISSPWGKASGTDVVFCVGPNPLLKALRLHAELNLYKIRNCRSIDGLRRSLDFYSAATDPTAGLPMIGADGQLVLSGARQAPPTPYRYAALTARANELARAAQQLEATMLAAIERRDQEAYTILQARQGARVARETVRLSELEVRTAEDRVVYAETQQNRALVEQELYSQLITLGDSELEREALDLLQQSISAQSTAEILGISATIGYGAATLAYLTAAATGVPSAIGQALSSAAQTLSSAGGAAAAQAALRSAQSQLAANRATMQRTRDDWRMRQRLATEDIKTTAQLVQVETDGMRVAEQQRTISELSADNADRLVDFLDGKFTGVELFDWMSETHERVYSTVLQHATATARMAANQLAFERQEGDPPTIAGDYWIAPPRDGETGTGDGVDRRGLTGAERLLADLVTLDQYAFETQRRKHQLTKTISLGALAPLELEQLRSAGVMTFTTPMELFDRDFPGHYLRLIKRVTVSVIALIPPTDGIHATLSSTGASRVVVGPELFQTTVVRRPGQSVALTSPIGATGVFTFDSQPELANPFEFEGVDTTWELRLPHAGNRFDFRSIADVLLTIDYTALDSPDYRDQVVRRLDRRLVAERPISLRSDFPDAWWELHNPDQTATPHAVTFETLPPDFPPNVDDLEIEHLALMISARTTLPRALTLRLRFGEQPEPDGGPPPRTPWLAASPIDGVISTRRGNAGSWLSLLGRRPVGQWELSLPDTDEVRDWFVADLVDDILIVVSYRGRTRAWPS